MIVSNTQKEKNVLKIMSRVINLILITLLCYVMACMIYQCVVNVRIGETRMSTKVIDDFIHGVNPYGTEWLEDMESQPPIYYESGFFHLLPSVLLGKLFHINCFISASLVHAIYVISATFVMIWLVYKTTNCVSLGLLAANLFFFCLNFSDYSNARPDTLCSLCIVSILLLIYWDKDYYGQYKSINNENKSEKNTKLLGMREWLVALLVVLLLFLKIHYASILFALFFVYIKRKRIFPMLLKGITIFLLTVFITLICFPTFFSTFGVRVLEMLRQNTEVDTIGLMWIRWGELLGLYLFPCLLTIFGMLFPWGKVNSFSMYLNNKINILRKDDFILLLVINILFNFAALCFMGKWPGNGIIYHETMIMSSVIVSFCMVLSTIWNHCNRQRVKYVLSGIITIVSLFMVYNSQDIISGDFSSLSLRVESREAEISELDKYYSEHMLLAPEKSFYAMKRGIYQWDYGDQIYLPYDIGSSPRWNMLFPYTNEYRRRNIEYANKMIAMIENQEYSIIITDEYNILGKKIGLHEEFQQAIENNYETIKTEGVLTYWIPRSPD